MVSFSEWRKRDKAADEQRKKEIEDRSTYDPNSFRNWRKKQADPNYKPPVRPAPASAPEPAPEAPAYDEASLLQQLFDIKNRETGESYLYGNRPEPMPTEDIQRIVADTASRGFFDKATGGSEETAAARERAPDWIETPLDVGTAIATSPYRVGSMGAGGLFGAAEGALSAYGNQDEWTPDWKNIAGEAGKGAALGALGAKGGEMITKALSKRAAKGAQTYKTNEELMEDVGKVDKRTKAGKDVVRRGERVEEARQAQMKGQKGFEDLLAGVEGYGHKASGWKYPELEALRAVVEKGSKPGAVGDVVSGAGNLLKGGKNRWAQALLGVATKGYAPAIGNVLEVGGDIMSGAAKSSRKEQELLMALLRDPKGRGLAADPETVAKGRDLIAKLMMQGSRDE